MTGTTHPDVPSGITVRRWGAWNGDGLVIDVDTNGMMQRTRTHPFARRTCRTAEVLAKTNGWPSSQVLKSFREELDLSLHVLYSLLVQFVDIGLLSHPEIDLFRACSRHFNPPCLIVNKTYRP